MSDASGSPVLVVAFGDRLFGMRREDGAVLFEHEVPFNPDVEVVGNRIIVCGGGCAVCCFEYPSGRPLGRAEVEMSQSYRPTMLIEGDRIFIGASGQVACLDLDGRVLWTEKFKGKGMSPVAFAMPGVARQADHTR